jgi:hypothetical protein
MYVRAVESDTLRVRQMSATFISFDSSNLTSEFMRVAIASGVFCAGLFMLPEPSLPLLRTGRKSPAAIHPCAFGARKSWVSMRDD